MSDSQDLEPACLFPWHYTHFKMPHYSHSGGHKRVKSSFSLKKKKKDKKNYHLARAAKNTALFTESAHSVFGPGPNSSARLLVNGVWQVATGWVLLLFTCADSNCFIPLAFSEKQGGLYIYSGYQLRVINLLLRYLLTRQPPSFWSMKDEMPKWFPLVTSAILPFRANELVARRRGHQCGAARF